MKASLVIPAVLTLALAGALGLSQPEKAPPPPAQPQKPAAQPPAPPPAKPDAPKADAPDAAQIADEPGPIHARLMKLAGDWEANVKLEIAGQPPMSSKGSLSIKSELGGRFLHERGGSDAMGQHTEEFKMWGFNNGSKKYEATWTWTLSTGFLHMTGQSKDDGKTIDWDAWFDNESGKREEFKAQHVFADNDHFSVKLFGGKLPDGTPGPTMTVTYARKK